jgi:hypothetical protein
MIEQVADIKAAASEQAFNRRPGKGFTRKIAGAEIDRQNISERRVSMCIVHGDAGLSAINGLALKADRLSCIYSLNLI